MESAGYLKACDGRVEIHFEAMGLVVRGDHVEWVLEAAAEVIGQTERLRSEVRIEELEALGAASEAEIETARHDARQRFEVIPQCVVSTGTLDYKWTSRSEHGTQPAQDRRSMRANADTT